jgi:hypothetical protein
MGLPSNDSHEERNEHFTMSETLLYVASYTTLGGMKEVVRLAGRMEGAEFELSFAGRTLDDENSVLSQLGI